MEGFWKIIAIIIAAVAVLLFLYGLFVVIWPEIRAGLQNIFGGGIDDETKEQIMDNFDILNENMKSCNEIDDEDCFCDVLPDFPSVFHKNFVLRIDDNRGRLTLFNKNDDFANSSLGDMAISAISMKALSSSALYPTFLGIPYVSFVYFNEAFPKINKVNNGYIISNKFYKEYKDEFHMVTYNTGYPERPNLLQRLKPVQIPAEDEAKKVQEVVDNMPRCLPGRQKAIEEFDKIAKGRIGQVALNLPEDYEIKISNSEILLQYNGADVKKIQLGGITEFAEYERVWSYKVVKDSMPLCESSSARNLRGQDAVELKDGCLFIA